MTSLKSITYPYIKKVNWNITPCKYGIDCDRSYTSTITVFRFYWVLLWRDRNTSLKLLLSIQICSPLCLFLFVAVPVCGRFGLWPLRFVAVPVCGRSGLWPFRFVAVQVRGRFGLWPFRFWPFRFVAVMTRIPWFYVVCNYWSMP